MSKSKTEENKMKVKKMIKSDVSTFKVGDIIKVRLTDGEKALAMAV